MVRGPIDSGLPGLPEPQETLASPGPSTEAPRSPCPGPVRGVTDSERTAFTQSSPAGSAAEGPGQPLRPAPTQLSWAWRPQAWPGPGWGEGQAVWGTAWVWHFLAA